MKGESRKEDLARTLREAEEARSSALEAGRRAREEGRRARETAQEAGRIAREQGTAARDMAREARHAARDVEHEARNIRQDMRQQFEPYEDRELPGVILSEVKSLEAEVDAEKRKAVAALASVEEQETGDDTSKVQEQKEFALEQTDVDIFIFGGATPEDQKRADKAIDQSHPLRQKVWKRLDELEEAIAKGVMPLATAEELLDRLERTNKPRQVQIINGFKLRQAIEQATAALPKAESKPKTSPEKKEEAGKKLTSNIEAYLYGGEKRQGARPDELGISDEQIGQFVAELCNKISTGIISLEEAENLSQKMAKQEKKRHDREMRMMVPVYSALVRKAMDKRRLMPEIAEEGQELATDLRRLQDVVEQAVRELGTLPEDSPAKQTAYQAIGELMNQITWARETEKYMPGMVFLSYSHANEDMRDRILHGFDMAGVNYWVDKENLVRDNSPKLHRSAEATRASYDVEIQQAALPDATDVLCLVTAEVINNITEVKKELVGARTEGKDVTFLFAGSDEEHRQFENRLAQEGLKDLMKPGQVIKVGRDFNGMEVVSRATEAIVERNKADDRTNDRSKQFQREMNNLQHAQLSDEREKGVIEKIVASYREIERIAKKLPAVPVGAKQYGSERLQGLWEIMSTELNRQFSFFKPKEVSLSWSGADADRAGEMYRQMEQLGLTVVPGTDKQADHSSHDIILLSEESLDAEFFDETVAQIQRLYSKAKRTGDNVTELIPLWTGEPRVIRRKLDELGLGDFGKYVAITEQIGVRPAVSAARLVEDIRQRHRKKSLGIVNGMDFFAPLTTEALAV